MKHFIKLTEVQNKNNKDLFYDDYIRPEDIRFLEVLSDSSSDKIRTKIHFAVGEKKCEMIVKESPAEIDDIIDNFYKDRKKRISPEKKKRATGGALIPN